MAETGKETAPAAEKRKVKVESGGTWTGASMNGDTDIDLEGKWQQTGKSKVRKLIPTTAFLIRRLRKAEIRI